jgi:uncharacterized protein YbjT (DUF2867 family)
MGKILVTGATGTNGKALVKKLQERNADFVTGSRNPENNDNSSRKLDFSDPSTYDAATEGVDRVFLLGPPMQADVDKLIGPFIDHLKEKGIRRVVYFSALGADKMGDTMSFHGRVEDKLRDGDFEYTILKPTFFAQNFKNYEWDNITQRGVVYMPAGEGRVAFIDVEDIAEVAAIALTENGHDKKTYSLTGGKLLSYYDAANTLTDVMDRQIVYPNPSADEFRNAVVSSGAPEFVADYLINVYGAIAANHTAVITDDVEKVTGRKPGSFSDVVKRDFA